MLSQRIALTIAALVLMGGAAQAADFVVVEADGIHLAPGQTIDGAKPFNLQDGQAVTLLSQSGEAVHIDGPSTAAPDSLLKGPATADVKTAMAALITEGAARTSEVGVVRGENAVKLPDPWVVDVSHPGTSCVREGEPVVLWRSAPFNAAQVAFAPKDRSWNIAGTWPANADRVTLPPNMPLQDDWDYVVEIAGKAAPVTIRLLPKSVDNDAMRAGYMREVGCGNQLSALLAAYQK